jgi:hypothetical protein
MYKFGISYYMMSAASRIPLTGVKVRLVRPGSDFYHGIPVHETPANSGYYETDKLEVTDWGFYEIWDDRVKEEGSFSGKTCIVGQLDSYGIKDKAIGTNQVDNEAITSDKLSAEAVKTKNLANGIIPLSKMICEIQDQSQGRGMQSNQSPPHMELDDLAEHILVKEYDHIPHIILTPWCDSNLFIKDVKHEERQIIITIAKGQRFDAPEWRYTILAISSEPNND